MSSVISGKRLASDLGKIFEIDKGKTVNENKYARDLYCKKPQLPTVCTFPGEGQVFVE